MEGKTHYSQGTGIQWLKVQKECVSKECRGSQKTNGW